MRLVSHSVFTNQSCVFIGGGIVFDSDEYDEWLETINKLGANMSCIASAEELYHAQQQTQNGAK